MFIFSGAVCPHSFITFTAMFTGVCVILRITLVNHMLFLSLFLGVTKHLP